MYNIDYFISKFQAIPEELWCVGALSNGQQRCALGHCLNLEPEMDSRTGYGTDESQGLARMCSDLGVSLSKLVSINNGKLPEYNQYSPKHRVLAYLYDVRAKHFPEYKNITKELAVLPINETSDLVNCKSISYDKA